MTMARELVGLDQILEDLNREYGWTDPAAKFSVLSATVWRHSTLYRVTSTAGDDLVLKRGGGAWASVAASEVAAAMNAAAAALGEAGLDGVQALRPIASWERPKIVVTPHIEGEDLSSVFRNAAHPYWDERSGALDEWLVRAGRGLAAYHRNSDMDGSSYAAAITACVKAGRDLLVGRDSTMRLAPSETDGLHARSYVDLDASNFRRSGDGVVWFLDPPIEHSTAFIHRDVANFVVRAERNIKSNARAWAPERIADAFVRGYAELGASLDRPEDAAMLDLFRARFYLGLARSALRRGSIGRTRLELARCLRARRRAIQGGGSTA